MIEVPNADRLTVRWTIGDVRPRGFEMLRLSLACARNLFGPSSRFVVCVNTRAVADVKELVGCEDIAVEWLQMNAETLPTLLKPFLDEDHMEGMAWKLAPIRIEPAGWELAIDNDCILWDLPEGMREWLASPHGGLLAEDVDRCLGSFDALCPPGGFNAGIRGLGPAANLEQALRWALQEAAALRGGTLRLKDEIEEQGLQAAAMLHLEPLRLVRIAEVTLCSPFWPKTTAFGTCGAHFVGMNSKHIPWNYYDRPADDWLAEHWARSRPELYRRAGLPEPQEY